MEITIGTRFEKRIGKTINICCVSDIIDCTYYSRAMGNTSTQTIYYAKSETFGMGKSFEVPKNTILRSLIKPNIK